MPRSLFRLFFCPLLLNAALAFSQTAVTTTGGNAGAVPVFNGSSTVVPSPLSVTDQGFVSVGTPFGGVMYSAHQLGAGYGYPRGMFEAVTDNPSGSSNYYFRGWTDGVATYSVRADGWIFGSGIDTFSGYLGSAAGDELTLMKVESGDHNWNQFSIKQFRHTAGEDWTTATTRLQLVTDYTPQGYIDYNPQNAQYGLSFGNLYGEFARFLSDGRLGVGTVSPSQKLDVAGNIAISGAGAGLYFPGSTTPQTVPWTGTLCGGDYAESIEVTNSVTTYEPGDVLVLDPQNPEHFKKADTAYSTLVAGVYSTKPGVIGRHQATAKSDAEIPMAMIGIVPTKVSAVNGPVHVGDLLVASATAGVAMKGTDSTRLVGAVIGKAMADVQVGTATVNVLVTLQ